MERTPYQWKIENDTLMVFDMRWRTANAYQAAAIIRHMHKTYLEEFGEMVHLTALKIEAHTFIGIDMDYGKDEKA